MEHPDYKPFDIRDTMEKIEKMKAVFLGSDHGSMKPIEACLDDESYTVDVDIFAAESGCYIATTFRKGRRVVVQMVHRLGAACFIFNFRGFET